MALRRRYGRRRPRRVGGARMRMRGARRYGPARRTLLTGVHRFKETVQIASITAPGSGNTPGRLGFQISDLTNWVYFKSLFDLYKITAVKLKLVPKWNMSSADTTNAGLAAGNLPMLYIAANRDPYVPASINIGDVINDDTCKIIRVTKPINLYLSNPKPDITNEGGNIPFQFGVSKKFQPWLTTGGNNQTVNQENTTHYGFRYWLANGNGLHEVDLDCYVTYYFTMKEQD